MNLSNLKPAEGSTKTRKRIGRGPGSGLGGTSTRGHKGAKSRSGYKNKIGFEGGQMPIQRRLPKFGFKNINRVEYKAINIDTLQQMAEAKQLTKIGINELMEAGFISSSQVVKILGNGSLTAKLEVEAHAFSKSAEAAIQAAGGTHHSFIGGYIPFWYVCSASGYRSQSVNRFTGADKRRIACTVGYVLRWSLF